ncbi:hypothetical protein [Roseovarius amoyensis]|uniref:hypothetical protein n=1 Tax=Roseovarius amoyensis TaxID=2211448 RepID=UPI000DBE83D3|nr:hypothetical protein [Roseovarius amoyensis]
MSFKDCIQDAMDDPEVSASKAHGKEAQRIWEEQAAAYERQGYSRRSAEEMAGADVKEYFKRKSGDDLHRALAEAQVRQSIQKRVADHAKPHKSAATSVERMEMESRGLLQYARNRLTNYLRDHHQNLLNKMTKPAEQINIVRALSGEKVDDAAANAMADSIRSVVEELRLFFNEAGGVIRKLENYDVPHRHNPSALRRAGKKAWVNRLLDDGMIDWTGVENYATGRPFQVGETKPPRETLERFLGEIWDNIVFGKAGQGRRSLVSRRAEARVLKFASADKWMEYNKDFGDGDFFKTLMGHLNAMADDIAALRTFGADMEKGIQFEIDVARERAKAEGRSELVNTVWDGWAKGMAKVFRGPGMAPQDREVIASLMSTVRHVMTAGMLDRAIVPSISDFSSAFLTANAAGLNKGNIFSAYAQNLKAMIAEGRMTTEMAMQHRWAMSTLSDAGGAVARFHHDVPGAEWAETLSSMAMKVQGLSQHTDNLRFALNLEFWGKFAREAKNGFDSIDPDFRRALDDYGIRAEDWEKFRNGPKYTAGAQGRKLDRNDPLYRKIADPLEAQGLETGDLEVWSPVNGEAVPAADFLNPHHWLANTDLPRREAMDIFMKFQGFVEEWQERAVPTNRLQARAIFDPTAYGMVPGTFVYEVMKSAGMFKSFVGAFTINQIRLLHFAPDMKSRATHGAYLVGGMTALGAVAQVTLDVLSGNDPSNVNPVENPAFWWKAMLRGGGLGPIGDIMQAGEMRYGGGFSSYLAGPGVNLTQDLWSLTYGNLSEVMEGKDPRWQKDVIRILRRNTPLADTPLAGPAVQRLIFDELHKIIDPEAQKTLRKAAAARKRNTGNDAFWPIGSTLPERAPNLGAIIGGQ